MKKTKNRTDRKANQTEKMLEEKHYRIIIGLMIFGIVYYFFLKPITIGNDVRYSICIFWLPTIFGMLVLGIYRKNFLIKRFATKKIISSYIFDIFYFLLQGIIFSYLSFGQLASITWEILNYKEAKQNPQEIIECDIERFWLKKNPTIDFKLDNKFERFKVKYSEIKQYSEENPMDYKINIKVHKGIWNHYLVEDYEIEKK